MLYHILIFYYYILLLLYYCKGSRPHCRAHMHAAHTGSAAALAHPRFSHTYVMPLPSKAAVKEAAEMVVARGLSR